MNKAKAKKILKKLKNKYRLKIYNESTFEELLSFRLSRLNVFNITIAFSVILIILVILLISATPLKEFIPGYPDKDIRNTISRNALIVDSIKNELQKRDRFFNSIQNIISGNDFKNTQNDSIDTTTGTNYKDIEFSRSQEDSIFRREVEETERYNLTIKNAAKTSYNISNIYFFSPVRGVITSHFNSNKQHFGTDIVSVQNERISTVLSGTVIFTGWTLNTGYVIQIQHSNSLLSIYKHNSELLKKVGDRVKAGETIALLGNSGELTSGPHLHFELWHNGKPLNPENYIKF